jgi:DNA-binding HxlR family transcriptional regulator
MSSVSRRTQRDDRPPACCPFYHEAVELIGRRWTGAIVAVLLDGGDMRFSEIANAVPELSDRLLTERMKELEARGVVARRVDPGPPMRVTYALTPMGRSLEPALVELRDWARRWLAAGAAGEEAGRPVAVRRETARRA